MQINAAEKLTNLEAPNNILTRNLYRAGYATIYGTLSVVVRTTALVTRKDRMEVLKTVANKLNVDTDTFDDK